MSLFSFYVQPIYISVIEFVSVYLLWLLFVLIFPQKFEKIKKTICIAVSLFAIALIVAYTILGRGSGAREISPIPFVSFVKAQYQPEMYRSMLMNVFLFAPFGLAFPFALPMNNCHNIAITMLVGFSISVFAELSQLIFGIGLCETDDVIMNTLGVLVGTTVYIEYNWINKMRDKQT